MTDRKRQPNPVVAEVKRKISEDPANAAAYIQGADLGSSTKSYLRELYGLLRRGVRGREPTEGAQKVRERLFMGEETPGEVADRGDVSRKTVYTIANGLEKQGFRVKRGRRGRPRKTE